MRVAFLASSFLDPDNPRSWSGLPYFLRRTLEGAGLETVTLFPKESGHLGRWLKFFAWKLRGRRYLRHCDEHVLRDYGRQYARLIESAAVDAVFSPSTWLLADLETELPCVLWTDACFAGILDFYEAFTRLAPSSVRAGHAIEQRALRRCARVLYCSDWAAETALRAYSLDPAKVGMIPFGGNLMEPPGPDEAAAMVRARPAGCCELLLVGVDWKRKGADVAVGAVRALVAAGIDARLTVVGCEPPRGTELPEEVRVVPFIGKETAEGRQRIREHFSRSHFFIMPTRAEAFGLVFAEACAFGLPCLATDVGGLRSVIRDGVNGRLFPLEAGAEEYAAYIAALVRQPARYRELALGAARDAATRLSWKVSGRRVAEVFTALTAPPRAMEAAAP